MRWVANTLARPGSRVGAVIPGLSGGFRVVIDRTRPLFFERTWESPPDTAGTVWSVYASSFAQGWAGWAPPIWRDTRTLIFCSSSETASALLRQSQIFKRFVHEAEVAVRSAPNVAAVVAMGNRDKEPFLATEYVFGVAMSQIIERIETAATNPVPPRRGPCMVLSSRAQSTNSSAHHLETERAAQAHPPRRDRPKRVGRLRRDPSTHRLRAREVGARDWQTAHQAVASSPDYIPPEQARAGASMRAPTYTRRPLRI